MPRVKPIAMTGIDGIFDGRSMAGLQQTGSIRRGDGYGAIRFGHTVFGAIAHAGGVYQKRVTGYNSHGRSATSPRKTYYVKMRYYRPTNPNTPIQQSRRSLFGDAMRSWQALSAADKQYYNSKANRQCRRGFNLYVQQYMIYNGAIPIIQKE